MVEFLRKPDKVEAVQWLGDTATAHDILVMIQKTVDARDIEMMMEVPIAIDQNSKDPVYSPKLHIRLPGKQDNMFRLRPHEWFASLGGWEFQIMYSEDLSEHYQEV